MGNRSRNIFQKHSPEQSESPQNADLKTRKISKPSMSFKKMKEIRIEDLNKRSNIDYSKTFENLTIQDLRQT